MNQSEIDRYLKSIQDDIAEQKAIETLDKAIARKCMACGGPASKLNPLRCADSFCGACTMPVHAQPAKGA